LPCARISFGTISRVAAMRDAAPIIITRVLAHTRRTIAGDASYPRPT